MNYKNHIKGVKNYYTGFSRHTSLFVYLKDCGQPPPLLMLSKLLMLHGESKSYCLISCVPESTLYFELSLVVSQ